MLFCMVCVQNNAVAASSSTKIRIGVVIGERSQCHYSVGEQFLSTQTHYLAACRIHQKKIHQQLAHSVVKNQQYDENNRYRVFVTVQ